MNAFLNGHVYSHAIPALQEQAVRGLAGALLAQAPEGTGSSR